MPRASSFSINYYRRFVLQTERLNCLWELCSTEERLVGEMESDTGQINQIDMQISQLQIERCQLDTANREVDYHSYFSEGIFLYFSVR